MLRVWWPTAPKGIPLLAQSLSQDNRQNYSFNPTHSFLNKLFNQPDITDLLNDNYIQHQTTLIHHDLDQIEPQASLVHQLLIANLLTITTHNTRKLSDTTKYAQLLETLTLHKVDICGVTETDHTIRQKYKHSHHLDFLAFWNSTINRHTGVSLILHHKWCPYIQATCLQSDPSAKQQ